MSDKPLQRFRGERHNGPDNSAPYPVSRMAPTTELVDLAAQIAEADTMLANVTHGKLRQIAEQIRGLQQQASAILQATARDQQLHRAQCNFQRKPGRTYHHYRRGDGREYLSMLTPAEWGGEPPHTFVGSFRLENDMSWTPLEEVAGEEQARALVREMLTPPQ
jgi:hypothetical protein